MDLEAAVNCLFILHSLWALWNRPVISEAIPRPYERGVRSWRCEPTHNFPSLGLGRTST